MKEKIAAALKTKYQRFGLSNEAIDRIASAKEKTVNGEDEIEAAVADAETMGLIANELMKMRDKEISNKTDLQRAFDTYKEKNPASADKPEPAEQEEKTDSEWVKRIEAIEARFAKEDKEKATKAAMLTVKAKLRESIPDNFYNDGLFNLTLKGFSLGENEPLDDAAKRLYDEYQVAYKETIGNGAVPGLGGQAFGDTKAAVSHKNDFLRQQGLLPQKEK